MSIRILCVGKTKQEHITQGIQEYLKRLQPFHSIQVLELPDVSLHKVANPEEVKMREAEIIRKAMKQGEFNIILDERGEQITSVDLSKWLAQQLGFKDLCFIIGGVYGLHDSIRRVADLVLGFSKMTFTHQMIRLMLVEQLYRAFMIMKNKPYHY
ncbi:MAG TPA: 23S rRNA (pseudouridine(1915)-N(3))-methyltransferase RlmH [Candidatus Cloacimonadota bacterium]|nr:23S rRNA (pseudouridine(1915)-N(3))-methyltransferase RlmH [Candidatus Cloacimonadota bacterium]HPT72013.1 23S rRNA (pseudouridine(1915)-N(3))-methyltransferase RlmH [Candidatus Cloacimonadota bacterium]